MHTSASHLPAGELRASSRGNRKSGTRAEGEEGCWTGAALAPEQLLTLTMASHIRSDAYVGSRGWTEFHLPSTPRVAAPLRSGCSLRYPPPSQFRRCRGAPSVRRRAASLLSPVVLFLPRWAMACQGLMRTEPPLFVRHRGVVSFSDADEQALRPSFRSCKSYLSCVIIERTVRSVLGSSTARR